MTERTENDADSTGWTERDRLASLSSINEPGLYLRGSYLGCGGWSQVHKVLRKSDGQVFAGKSSKSMDQLKKEAAMIRRLEHKHVVKFVDWYENKDNSTATLLVTELCPEGNLQTLIDHGSSGMGRCDILQTVIQIAGVLEYLHAQDHYHSDVKPRNILIRRLKPLDVVLADMADVKQVCSGSRPTFRGTVLFASPEAAFSGRHYGPSDDMWALGITLLAMMEQSPRVVCTKKGIKEYPRTCFEHVEQLRAMNPTHDLVGLLAKMAIWKADTRATASDCVQAAKELLDRGTSEIDIGQEGKPYENRLGIQAPDGFQAISFW